jgi:molecular chaperone DnaK (HSP70)
MKKSGIELHSIISDACSACLAYELDKDSGHAESNVLVYRLGGSTYECSIIRTIGGCFQTVVSVYGFDNSGDAFTDLLTDIIADDFQK